MGPTDSLDIHNQNREVTGKARFENWRKEIADAGEIAEVVQILARFMDSLDEVEVRTLPEPCRPNRLSTAQDVANCAFLLVGACLGQEDPSAFLFLKEVSLIFADGSARIGRLALGREPLRIHPRLREEER
jgi:hypothetical protein